MTALAPHMVAFLHDYLPRERRASVHTCETYAHSYRLLICFAAKRLGIKPSQIEVEHLSVPMILAFLEHAERERGNSTRTRNSRLAAIKAFFRYLEYRLVSCLDQARQIHAIPQKKTNDALIDYLTRDEIQALLNAPDPRTIAGARDIAMLHLAFAGGLRVSELTSLRADQFNGGRLDSIRILGKGRRERILPLWTETTTALKRWLAVRPADGDPELFLNANGKTLSRFGFAHILGKHAAQAAKKRPSIGAKRVTPHVLRHSCAMHMLHATGDVRKVALWLGHASLQSTEIYLRVDPTEKLAALAAAAPPTLKKGRFRTSDKLIALLNAAAAANSYVE
jgi:site-specific recombinase XerD